MASYRPERAPTDDGNRIWIVGIGVVVRFQNVWARYSRPLLPVPMFKEAARRAVAREPGP